MLGNDEKKQQALDDEVQVCMLGVSVSFLMDFAKTVDPEWTTTDVCVKHVLPKTAEAKIAYYELNPDEKDLNGNKVIGNADYFCSHAWRYKFVNVVDALDMFCTKKRLKPEQTFIWFDLFINNQHMAPNLSYKWWCTTFKGAIKEFGKVVLVLEPWSDPIPMTRAWCLWEIFCTIDTNSEFNVAMCKKEHNDFNMKLVKNFEDIRTALSKVDARRGESWNEKDRKNIFEAIEKAVGFNKLNERVIGKMREWLSEAGKAHLTKTREEYGDRHVQTLETYNCLGKMYRDMNDYENAVHLFHTALNGFTEENGKQSLLKSEITNNLAFCFQKMDKLAEAIKLHKDCLCYREELYGKLNRNTTQSMSNLATALRMNGQLAEAKELFRDAVECRDKIKKMGPHHPATLYTVSQYALTLSECKEFEDAEIQHKRAIQGLLKFFDPVVPNARKHPLTLMALHNMGHHKMLRGEISDAENVLLEAYSGRLEKLGETAKATRETKQLLDKVIEALKEAGKQPQIEIVDARHVEAYLKDKDMRRKLWFKASNHLAFTSNIKIHNTNELLEVQVLERRMTYANCEDTGIEY